jgi:hypothetical protein
MEGLGRTGRSLACGADVSSLSACRMEQHRKGLGRPLG